MTVDANVLVYASNTADPAFGPARTLLERLATGPDLVYLFWPTIMGYLRIVTHPSILPRPLTFAEASRNISALLIRPHVRTAGESQEFWELYLVTAGEHIRGNDVSDAHLATLMRRHVVETILFTYYIEEDPVYLPLVDLFFEALAGGELRVATSTIALVEVLTQALRQGAVELASQCRGILLTTRG